MENKTGMCGWKSARVHLLVDGYFPEKEIRTPETAAAVAHVAAIPKVREWMKKTPARVHPVRQSRDGRPRHRHECFSRNGLQILPRRDAGRAFRAAAPPTAWMKTSPRATSATASAPCAPLMIALGAKVINNSNHDFGADERFDCWRKSEKLAQEKNEPTIKITMH
jgi:hypothetical protein